MQLVETAQLPLHGAVSSFTGSELTHLWCVQFISILMSLRNYSGITKMVNSEPKLQIKQESSQFTGTRTYSAMFLKIHHQNFVTGDYHT